MEAPEGEISIDWHHLKWVWHLTLESLRIFRDLEWMKQLRKRKKLQLGGLYHSMLGYGSCLE